MSPRLQMFSSDGDSRVSDLRPLALLAEPDQLRGALMAAGLEDHGIDVVWAGNGDAALLAAEERCFDVHIADPSLRSAQGERVVQQLVTEHPRVPLVVSGSSTAVVHLASARIPAADVVEHVRAELDQRLVTRRGHRTDSRRRASPD